MRFPKSARLLKHSDFERVYRQGRRISLADMAVFYVPRTEAERPAYTDSPRPSAASRDNGLRVGFTVPRALGGAVERNRIKRRMREAVRLNLAMLNEGEPNGDAHGEPTRSKALGADVVMNPRRSVAAMPFDQLLRQVGEAFSAIGRGKGSVRAQPPGNAAARAKK